MDIHGKCMAKPPLKSLAPYQDGNWGPQGILELLCFSRPLHRPSLANTRRLDVADIHNLLSDAITKKVRNDLQNAHFTLHFKLTKRT